MEFELTRARRDINQQKQSASDKESNLEEANAELKRKLYQGTKFFQYCTCPAGRVTYNFHSYCKQMHLSFKTVCNKEHKGVICNMTSSSNSSQSTRPTGRVLWE